MDTPNPKHRSAIYLLVPLSLALLANQKIEVSPADTSARSPSFFNVTGYGATGDGQTRDTLAIQETIDAAHRAGGGTVYFPPGRYLSGTIRLKSRVTLNLEAGATLLGSTDLKDYPAIAPAFRSYTEKYVCQSLIYAENADTIALVGRGTIDGQGKADAFKASAPTWAYRKRPYLIRFVTCRNVRVDDITLTNSPMWVQHYLACDDVVIRGITVRSQCNNNNDGIDIDCCRDVRISDCNIVSGDDAIVLKSTAPRPCENVAIANCVLSTHCNALKLGTETNGGFKNITISNCALHDVGLAGLTLQLVDGGTLENVTVSNITMRDVGGAVFIRLGNRARPHIPDGPKPGIGTLQNVVISNISATGCGTVGSSITGLPGHPIRNVSLNHIKIVTRGGGTEKDTTRPLPDGTTKYPEFCMFGNLPAYGLFCQHVDGLTFNDLDLRWAADEKRPALICDNVNNLQINDFSPQPPTGSQPVVVFKDVRDALLRGAVPSARATTFLHLAGDSEFVSVIGCDLNRTETPFTFDEPTSRAMLFSSCNRTATTGKGESAPKPAAGH